MSEAMYTAGEYLERNPRWHAEDSEWKAQQILRFMERNGLQPKSIGEIGCGAGEILHQLSLRMPSDVVYTGYEISPQALALCRERATERVRFRLGDLLHDPAAFFDVVMAIDVIEHVEDYFGFLRALRGKGARQIFHIPLELSVQTVLRSTPILHARQRVGHIHYFSKETALATLSDTGYRIIDYCYTIGSLDMPSQTFSGTLAKMSRKILYQAHRDIAARVLGGSSLLVLTA